MTTDLRYPIGPFTFDGSISNDVRHDRIDAIASAPARLREAVAGLTDTQLDTPYRPGGWTVRQVVHHVPDSHLNAYVRFRLSLTEDAPTIKPYAEARWADLPDARSAPPGVSLDLLDRLHDRWVHLLRSMSGDDWRRGYRHPELGRFVSLDEACAMYAWHGRHHVAHITSLRDRNRW